MSPEGYGGAAWKAAAAARDGQLDLCHVLMGSRHALIGSRPFEPMGVRSEQSAQCKSVTVTHER